MTFIFRSLVLLPVIILLLACGTLIPTQYPTPRSTSGEIHLLEKSSNPTTISSLAPILTTALPTPTPSAAISSALTPTAISLNTQLHKYEDLWSIVNDTYVYPDLNGLDRNVIHKPHRQIISTGLTNQQFYNRISKLLARLGVGRAYIIGTTTAGNVEILWGYDFEDGSQLWLANETFRPIIQCGQDWEQSGIITNRSVSEEFVQFSLNTYPAVLTAIQYLSGQ